jgi:ABC-type Fe3+/spermidine/putrescine transport system ATPase subunit
VATGGLRPGDRVLVSIRPHAIAVVDDGAASDGARTVVRGTVVRQAYLGDTVQMEVKLEGSAVTVRVATRASRPPGAGAMLTLAIPADAVVPIPVSGVSP